MKKLGFLFFIPLLVFTALPAKNAHAGTKVTIAKQELAVPAAEAATRITAFESRRASSTGSQQYFLRRFLEQDTAGSGDFQFLRRLWTAAEKAPRLAKGLGVDDIPVGVYDKDGVTLITEYQVGDTIVFRVGPTIIGPHWIELYVEADGVPGISEGDLAFDPGGDGEAVLQDGDQMDESPPGDGIWEITIDTGFLFEGAEIFAIQGITIHIYVYSADEVNTGTASVDALAPTAPASTTTLSGSVVEDATGIANLIVVAAPSEALRKEGPPAVMFASMTDAQGDYTIAIVDDKADQGFILFVVDPWVLYFGKYPKPLFLQTDVVAVGTTVEDLDFALVPGDATISGRVFDVTAEAGIANIGIEVEMDGPVSTYVVTDENGLYEVSVIEGRWYLEADEESLMDNGYMAHWEDHGVDIHSGETLLNVDFGTFPADGTISGTVTWSVADGGGPAANVEVHADHEGYYSRTMTLANGTYILPVSTALVYESEWGYWVNVWAGGALAQPYGWSDVYVPSADINFVLYEPTAALYGQIIDEKSLEPVPFEMELRANTKDEGDYFETGTWTRFDGSYRLPLLGGREWLVALRFPDSPWDAPPVAVDSFELAIDQELEHHWYISVPGPPLEIVSAEDRPDDQGGIVEVIWRVDPEMKGGIRDFVLWQVGTDPAGPDLFNRANWLLIPRGVIRTHPEFDLYGFLAPTVDSVKTWFMVTAYDWERWPMWDTDPFPGVSYDNLPPDAPGGVLAKAVEGGVELTWEPVTMEPIKYYTIERAPEVGEFAIVGYAEEPLFVDPVTPGTYRWRVSATDYGSNTSDPSPVQQFTLDVMTGVELPEVYALGTNYPNPFNPSTTITYQLPEAGHVTLQVYDLTGKVVSTLVSDYRPAGYHQVVWNGRDSKAAPVATGVYFYRIVAGQAYTETRKMVLMK